MTSVMCREKQTAMTPGDALRELKEGNERFVSGTMRQRDLIEQARATAEAQAPHSAILTCIDSRVTPEYVFDQGIGDIFCGRVAGNYVSVDALGGFEFAAKVVGVKLIVVMGHTNCGAMLGACDGVKLGNLTAALGNLMPAVESVTGKGERSSSNLAFVTCATEANVRLGVQRFTEQSEVLSELVQAGELRIVGAMHDMASGRVTFYDE